MGTNGVFTRFQQKENGVSNYLLVLHIFCNKLGRLRATVLSTIKKIFKIFKNPLDFLRLPRTCSFFLSDVNYLVGLWGRSHSCRSRVVGGATVV